MTGHTPGPWKVEEQDGAHIILMGTALTSRAQHEVQHSIVYDHGLFPGDDETPESDQWVEAEANARLIAAAPDLYASLKAMLDADYVGYQGIDTAIAAIAKAEGRDQ